jgi:RNA polymerase sigma factor (sigma-70 family)
VIRAAARVIAIWRQPSPGGNGGEGPCPSIAESHAAPSRNPFELPPFVVQGANGREGRFVARKSRWNGPRPPFVHPDNRLAAPRAYPLMLVPPVGSEDGLCYPRSMGTRPATPSAALEHVDALYRLARHLTGSDSDAEDLVQETYARALGARNQFVAGTNLRAWLFRILRNAYIDAYRRAQKSPVLGGLEDDDRPDTAGALREVLRGDDELDRLRTVVARDIETALGALSGKMVIWATHLCRT